MESLHLLRPWWLLVFPAGSLLLWLVWGRGRAGSWHEQCDPVLLRPLTIEGGSRRRLALAGIVLVALLVATLALAGPSWRRLEQPVHRSLAARVVVLDLSRSMDSADLAPTRLERARYKAADVLARSRGIQTGLVVFAGEAFVVSPLTDNPSTLTSLLRVLSTGMMPVQGSRPDLGLDLARRLLEQTGTRTAEVVLVTDGGDPTRLIDAAARLRAAGFRLSTLAVGTAEGAPIRLRDGGFLRDASDRIVVPRLAIGPLRDAARAGGGLATQITTDDADLVELIGAAPPAGGAAGTEQTGRTAIALADDGVWLVLALLPLGALAFRRGWLLGACVMIATIPDPALALDWASLWQRPDQRAAEALSRGDPAETISVAPDASWRSAAHYRAGDYAAAAEGYASVQTTTGHYNRGNALARSGRLEEAISAYDAALARAPAHADAGFNRDLVRSLLAARRRASADGSGAAERPGEDGPPDASRPDSGRSRSDNPGSPRSTGPSVPGDGQRRREDEPGGSRPSADERTGPREDEAGNETSVAADAEDGEARPGGPAEASDSGAADAQSRAGPPGSEVASMDAQEASKLARWLRRIPDDPGGLLRRKFAYEHKRRGGRADPVGPAW